MRRHPKRARVSATQPSSWATDDRSGFIGNHKNMVWQFEWGGTRLINKRILVYPDMLDRPQRQLGSVVIPPDPVPVMNARPEQYFIDEYPVSTRYTVDGRIRVTSYRPYPIERIVTVPGNIKDI